MVAWAQGEDGSLAAKGREGVFRDDRNVSYPNCSGFIETCTCQNSSNCTFDEKIYLDELYF